MIVTALNPFETFRSLGFTRLVPIIPPDAEVSEKSSLAKRKDARGKAVGIRGRDGLWRGMDWVHYEADEADFARWHAMGAGVGVKTGQGLVAIDADTMRRDHAKLIAEITEKHFGRLPIRIGRHPKALYVLRVAEPVPYMRVEFDGGGSNFGEPTTERVEILSDGRQFVAHGIHPVTKEFYYWPQDIFRFDDIPVVPRADLEAYLEALRAALPAARPIHKERDPSTKPVNQESLRGDPETVRRAVAAIPNSGEHFESREEYLRIAYAIKAAIPDDEATAFDIFSDFCARWQDGENKPEIIEADWRRAKPPYRIGAGYLYDTAEALSGGRFSIAEAFFDDLELNPPPEPNPFEAQRERELAEEAGDTYPVLTIADLANRPPPTWLIERHIPDKSLGFLYSAPGVGKTFLALDMALHVATGRDNWHGDPLHADAHACVLYIAAEGSFDLNNRIAAWFRQHGIDPGTARFALIEQAVNFMDPEAIAKLTRTIDDTIRARPALIIVDTVSRALPGADENQQKEMTKFIAACDHLKDRYKAAVLGIHHAGKAGDMRGSTVLLGAGDYVFHLTRKKGASVGLLECEKMKAAPDGWEEPYRFDKVDLPDNQQSLTVARADVSLGPARKLTPGAKEAVFAAITSAWEAGEPWSRAPQAKERFAIRRMVTDHGFNAEDAENTLDVWLGSGLLQVALVSTDTKKRGLRVALGGGQTVLGEGVFS